MLFRSCDDAFPSRAGYGEAALFRGLSAKEGADYEERLAEVCNGVCKFTPDAWQAYPSLCFGMETTLADFEGGGLLFPSAFTSGEAGIPINGLIWMGHHRPAFPCGIGLRELRQVRSSKLRIVLIMNWNALFYKGFRKLGRRPVVA